MLLVRIVSLRREKGDKLTVPAVREEELFAVVQVPMGAVRGAVGRLAPDSGVASGLRFGHESGEERRYR